MIIQVIKDLYRAGLPEATQIAIRAASASTDLDKKVRAQVAVLEGLLQVDLAEEEAARNAFTRAFKDDYDAALPADASPQAAELFKAAQEKYRKENPRRPPPPPAPPDRPSEGNEWKWGLLGGGAAGLIAGIAVFAGSNGQESMNTVGGALLGGGALSAIVGLAALAQQPPTKGGTALSFAVTPRGDVMVGFGARF